MCACVCVSYIYIYIYIYIYLFIYISIHIYTCKYMSVHLSVCKYVVQQARKDEDDDGDALHATVTRLQCPCMFGKHVGAQQPKDPIP